MIEGKVADLPGILHHALKFHHHVNLVTRGIDRRKRFLHTFRLRYLQVVKKVKVPVLIFQPEPESDGIFLLFEVDIMDTGDVHPHFHGIRGTILGLDVKTEGDRKTKQEDQQ